MSAPMTFLSHQFAQAAAAGAAVRLRVSSPAARRSSIFLSAPSARRRARPTALIVGEPGPGKSRLSRYFLDVAFGEMPHYLTNGRRQPVVVEHSAVVLDSRLGSLMLGADLPLEQRRPTSRTPWV